MRVMEFKLPESVEDFGRWLEKHNASVHIVCMFGSYHVTINCHSSGEYKEEGNLSFSRSSDFEVTCVSKKFNESLEKAVRAVEERR